MKTINNTHITFLTILLILILNIGCSNGENNKLVNLDNLMSTERFNELTVCECNEQANKILDNSTNIRNNFKSLDHLKKNNESMSNIKLLSKRWTTLLNSCFRKHGAEMWMPSDCNDLVLIEEKKLFLYNLGIQIDRGENIKL